MLRYEFMWIVSNKVSATTNFIWTFVSAVVRVYCVCIKPLWVLCQVTISALTSYIVISTVPLPMSIDHLLWLLSDPLELQIALVIWTECALLEQFWLWLTVFKHSSFSRQGRLNIDWLSPRWYYFCNTHCILRWVLVAVFAYVVRMIHVDSRQVRSRPWSQTLRSFWQLGFTPLSGAQSRLRLIINRVVQVPIVNFIQWIWLTGLFFHKRVTVFHNSFHSPPLLGLSFGGLVLVDDQG